VKLLQSGNEAMKANAALALGKLALVNDENRDKMKRRGAASLLTELRQNGTSDQKRNAAAALPTLSKTTKCSQKQSVVDCPKTVATTLRRKELRLPAEALVCRYWISWNADNLVRQGDCIY
jgi:hypothetical protein